MKTKHTKGEWIYSSYSNFDYGVYSMEGDSSDIALVRDRGVDGEAEANANLIAVAPELLDACIDILRILELNKTNTNLYQRNKLISLINKATE